MPKSGEKNRVKLADRLTFIFVSKVLLNLVLIVNVVGETFARTQESNDASGVGDDLFHCVCLLVTFTLALIVTFYEKLRFCRTSPPLSVFWILLLVLSIPTFKHDVETW